MRNKNLDHRIRKLEKKIRMLEKHDLGRPLSPGKILAIFLWNIILAAIMGGALFLLEFLKNT